MNDLLEYNIDYSLSEKIDRDFLIDQKLLPLQSHDFYVLIASAQQNCHNDFLVEVFKKPIKYITVNELEINRELQYLDVKIKLYKLAYNALQYMDSNDENSHIINFIDGLLLFSMEKM